MEYNLELVHKDLLCQWEGPEFCLLKYHSKHSGHFGDTSRLILDFKENNTEAVTIAVSLLLSAFDSMVDVLRDRRFCRYIVAVPPSSAGKPRASSERTCSEIAEHYTWLEHISAALARVESVQKSAYSYPGQRPSCDDHIRTIRYEGPSLDLRGQSVLVFDDVLTKGRTIAACRRILREATDCRSVFGVCLGRTQ